MTPINPQYRSIKYSFRRYYVDEFLARRVSMLPEGSLVLDLGGTRICKRGQFDIERYPLEVIYLNLSAKRHPHIQGDAASIPFASRCFDAIVRTCLIQTTY